MDRAIAITLLASTLLMTATSALADDPDELMPCKVVIVKAPPAAGGNGLTKFVCRGSFGLPSTFPNGGLWIDANEVPPGTGGIGSAGLGICQGLGNPAGSKGYKCALPPDVALVKTNVVKAVIHGDIPVGSWGRVHPFTADLAVKIHSMGSVVKRYCGRFPVSSALRNDDTQFKAKDAPAPAACSPSGAFLDAPAMLW
jgi:hypothetical protein